MVAPKDDDRVVRKLQSIEFVDYLSNLRVHIACARVLAMDQLPLQFMGEFSIVVGHRSVCRNLATAFSGNRKRARRRSLKNRRCELIRIIQIPILFGGRKRQMRSNKPNCNQEWSPRSLGIQFGKGELFSRLRKYRRQDTVRRRFDGNGSR